MARQAECIKQFFSIVSPGFAIDGEPARWTRESVLLLLPATVLLALVVGVPALPRGDEGRFPLSVVNQVLGGGMSSRLFQEIRERRGLAYSVYSYTSQYADTGLFAVYAGCAPGKVDEVLDLTRAELARVAADGLPHDEVARGRGMGKGGLVLGLEDTGSRMTRLGKGELLYGELLPVDELLARIDAVTPEQVRAVAAELLAQPMSLAVVGPFADHDFTI